MKFVENTYSNILKTVFGLANPIKKSIMNTHCNVHKYINLKSLIILKNDKYLEEYNLFNSYIDDINDGAVWADQDFKSSNHFYNPFEKKGLFGRKSAMDLTIEYYDKSYKQWKKGEFNKSMFYLGAAFHLIQDMTVPQHANIRLLDNHRQYELYIIRTYKYIKEFNVDKGTYLLDSMEEYVRFNTRVALKVYKRFNNIEDDEYRFYRTARCTITLAERTTAGAMVMFYNDVFSE